MRSPTAPATSSIGDRRVDAMLIEEVDVVGLEPAQRAFDHFANALRPAVPLGADLLAALDAKAEFGRDHDLVAAPFQRSAQQLLVGERPVDLGGVEEGAAELDCAMKRRNRLALVRRAIGLAHAHAAEADRGNLEPLAAELAFAQSHGSPSFDPAVLAR
jgi:hypothetical protein